MTRQSKAGSVAFLLFAFIVFQTATFVLGQESTEASESTETSLATDSESVGVTFAEPTEFEWELGVRITAKGDAKGITATAPIPIEWPEQKIEIVGQDKSGSVGRVSIKRLTKNSRQMLCKINRLKSGETAEAIVRLKIIKSHIVSPKDTTKLFFAENVPSKLKQYLRPSPYIESSDKRIEQIAQGIGTAEGLTDWQRVEEIYKWVRDNVEYKFDTKIHTCLEAIDSGHGDCEELSSLFIAICRAKNIPARAVWIPGHTYPEFYMTDAEGNGHWIPCQAAGSYQFGAMTESKPILQKGDRFKLPGNSAPLRYIQPTLVAKDAPNGLSFEFISRQANGDKQESTGRER